MLPSGSRLMGICLKFTVPFRLHQHGLEVMYLDHMNACFRNTRSFHLFDTTSMINPLIQCSYHLGGWVSQRDTLYLASASRRRRWEKEIENHRDTCFRRAFLGCDGCIIYQNRSWLCYIYIYLCSWIWYGSDVKYVGETWVMTLESQILHPFANNSGCISPGHGSSQDVAATLHRRCWKSANGGRVCEPSWLEFTMINDGKKCLPSSSCSYNFSLFHQNQQCHFQGLGDTSIWTDSPPDPFPPHRLTALPQFGQCLSWTIWSIISTSLLQCCAADPRGETPRKREFEEF